MLLTGRDFLPGVKQRASCPGRVPQPPEVGDPGNAPMQISSGAWSQVPPPSHARWLHEVEAGRTTTRQTTNDFRCWRIWQTGLLVRPIIREIAVGQAAPVNSA